MPTGQLALDRAYLVAIWLETLFYGINVCLFVSYVYIVRFRRARKISPAIFCVAVLMFCFSTIHVSLGFARLIWGFIEHRDAPGGPAAFFSDVSQPPNVAKVTIHTVNTILGDGIVVWRCWHVWGRSWKVCIAPVLLIAASAVCGFGQAHTFATATTTKSAFASTLARWNGSLFALSFVTNVVVTTLIAARLWFILQNMEGNALAGAPFRYFKIFMLIIESAMIYSAAILIEIILYFSGHHAFYIVYDPIAQLTGIVPTVIIIISTLGLTVEDVADGTTVLNDNNNQGRRGYMSSIQFNTMLTTRDYAASETNVEAASVSVSKHGSDVEAAGAGGAGGVPAVPKLGYVWEGSNPGSGSGSGSGMAMGRGVGENGVEARSTSVAGWR
ncbi:hypothetical protein C8Q76DRAFT_675570 [Earliella scabrosa]|nr:hypothetical protein C8Q76DRAFT_675570 [Earliella scabrosa]